MITPEVQQLLSLSAIIAALVALGGVVWSNVKTSQRQSVDLWHDSNERHRERIAKTRAEVYMELSAAAPIASEALANLPNLNLVIDTPNNDLRPLLSACAKCQLIGSQESASLSAELQNAYVLALTKLLIAARPIHELNTDISIADDLYKQSFADGQRVLAKIKDENESGRPDPVRFAALQRSFDNAQSSYTSFSDERNELWQRKLASQQAYASAVQVETAIISEIQINLNRSLRDELGLDTNIELFRMRSAQSREKMFGALNDFIANVTKPNNSFKPKPLRGSA